MTAQMDLLNSLPNKEYFTISEVAEFFDLKPHVLRYWEQQFKNLRPVKRNNRRYYQKRDIQFIFRLKDLLHIQGYSIQGAIDLLDNEFFNNFNTQSTSVVKSLVDRKIQDINIKIDGITSLIGKMR